MTIFAPHASNIGDADVPLICPVCGSQSVGDGLTDEQKTYLIRSTHHHRFYVEYRHMIAMQSIAERFPGTQHPLLRGKLDKPGRGFTNETQVARLLSEQPELCDFLRRSSFKLSHRFPFVRDALKSTRESTLPLLVTCSMCPDQYLILPDDYYQTIG